MADIYGAVTDSAVNRAIRWLMLYRPSLFNYAAPTEKVITDDQGNFIEAQEVFLLCQPVHIPPGVNAATYPRCRRMPHFKLPGFDVFQMPYCLQITDVELDFHPSNALNLPPELQPPLADQQFGLRIRAQFGLACLPDALVDAFTQNRLFLQRSKVRWRREMIVAVDQLVCFALEVYTVGHLYKTQVPGTPPVDQVRLAVDGMEIVDLQPPGLEAMVECYLQALLRGYVLPELVLGLEPIPVRMLGHQPFTLQPHLTPGLPHNPAIEQDELRVYIDVDIQ